MPTFLTSISRVLNCAKVHVAVSALVTTWFAVRYATAGLPPTQRSALWVAFIGAVAVALREIINAWTEEDIARVQGSGFRGQQGSIDTNQRAAIGNTQAVARAPLQRVSNRPPPDSLNPEPPTLNSPRPVSPNPELQILNPQRPGSLNPEPRTLNPIGASMPPRTKLPLLLAILLPLLALTACQTCPDLAVYRQGLHAVDEPLYQAHLLVMDDAVKAGIRSDADRAVVQQGIAAARALYNQSATTQPGQ